MVSLATLPPPLRSLATRVAGAAQEVTLAQVQAAAVADPDLAPLRTFLAHQGAPAVAPSGVGFSPLQAQLVTPTPIPAPLVLADGVWTDSITHRFDVPNASRELSDRQSVLVPLDARELHLIEIQYQDTRPLKDLEFSAREPGGSWKTFRGDEWFTNLAKEQAGTLEIRREPDHNAPYVNNPVRVKVEVLFADGTKHDIGTKYLDFHVHDAHSPESSGYPETDNISNGYESLPSGTLPPGAFLRLTPFFADKKPWESARTVAAELSWVRPIYVPTHVERASIHAASAYAAPDPAGYPVDPSRTLAGVLVNWSDEGGTASGSIRFATDTGSHESASYNVGSGETELIPVNAKAVDGRVFVEGWGVKVRNIDVLYAD